MKKTTIITLIFCVLSFNLTGKTINFNNNWIFQRLDKTSKNEVVENQGTSWESQYNVMHVSYNSELNIPTDTLNMEFALLQQGEWENIRLPHTPYIEDLVVLHQWEGISYYKKTFEAQQAWQGQQAWLEFGAAMQLADIWVNGKHIMQHAGGYTPFVVDLSKLLHFDKPNEILVRLDNRDHPLIPPGKPLSTLDFCYFGGLYRDVSLIVKPQTYISHPILANHKAGGGIFVSYPNVSKEEATISAQTHIVNESGKKQDVVIRQSLSEIKGLFVNHKTGKAIISKNEQLTLPSNKQQHHVANLNIANPQLWSPDAPHLYLLNTEILIDGKVVDSQETEIGIRHIEFTKERGFIINGEPLRLVGTNRHMEYPYIGNALSNNAQYRDIYQIKESGFNIVRLGHYPQDPSILAACDKLGVLVIEPIPGWQFFNKDQTFINLTHRDVKDMIRRDRNHPSIVMWETILNESLPPNEWKDEVVKIAHEEYPGDQFYTAGDTYGYQGFDVSYNDWKEGFHRSNNSKNAGFIREYYDYEFGGHYSSTRVGRHDGEKALLQNAWNAQWSHNRYRALYPNTSGDAIWSMYDYNRGCCDNICESGVADLFRIPKFSLFFFKSQMNINTPLPSGNMKPYIYIANYWTEREGKSPVVIFGNVDEVELKINGLTIARQKKDDGYDTDYQPTFDGGNCLNLTQAPFTFGDIVWQKGTLEAIGYMKGKKVTSQKIATPERVHELYVEYFEGGKKVAANDLIIVNVSLRDKNGTLCVDNNELVKLAVNKGNTIVGPTEVKTVAGIASFLVKTEESSKLEIHAHFQSLNATKTFKVQH